MVCPLDIHKEMTRIFKAQAKRIPRRNRKKRPSYQRFRLHVRSHVGLVLTFDLRKRIERAF